MVANIINFSRNSPENNLQHEKKKLNYTKTNTIWERENKRQNKTDEEK